MSNQNTLPVAYTVFCDDLRQEIGNKVSYMGVYQGAMLVEAFPLALPKLCAAVTLRRFLNEQPRSLVFRMFMDDTVVVERSIDTEVLVSQEQEVVDRRHEVGYTTAFFQFMPFAAKVPTQLKARVYLDDEELKAGALIIRALPRTSEVAASRR